MSPTFAGTDHLENHLCSASVVQPGLLIQHLLLLHFLFLQAETDGQTFPTALTRSLKRAAAWSESRVSPQTFSLFLPPPLLLRPRRSSGRERMTRGWLEGADKSNTWSQVKCEVPLPSCQHRRYTKDLLPKSCKYGEIINEVVE